MQDRVCYRSLRFLDGWSEHCVARSLAFHRPDSRWRSSTLSRTWKPRSAKRPEMLSFFGSASSFSQMPKIVRPTDSENSCYQSEYQIVVGDGDYAAIPNRSRARQRHRFNGSIAEEPSESSRASVRQTDRSCASRPARIGGAHRRALGEVLARIGPTHRSRFRQDSSVHSVAHTDGKSARMLPSLVEARATRHGESGDVRTRSMACAFGGAGISSGGVERSIGAGFERAETMNSAPPRQPCRLSRLARFSREFRGRTPTTTNRARRSDVCHFERLCWSRHSDAFALFRPGAGASMPNCSK